VSVFARGRDERTEDRREKKKDRGKKRGVRCQVSGVRGKRKKERERHPASSI
jgi:hypothetical protein